MYVLVMTVITFKSNNPVNIQDLFSMEKVLLGHVGGINQSPNDVADLALF